MAALNRSATNLLYFIHRNTECISHAFTIGRVCFKTVANMTDLDELWSITHGAGSVLKEYLLLSFAHQVEQFARLGVVIGIIGAEIPIVDCTIELQGRFFILRLSIPLVEAVGSVSQGAAMVAIYTHLTVAV